MTPDQQVLALPDLGQLERSAIASPALQVVREVLQLVKRDPSHFLRADFSDYPMPRQALRTIGALGEGQIGITIEGSLNGEDIKIDLFDPKLAPGTPKDESFSYRVNVFGGKEAEKYRKTIGFAYADNAYVRIAPDHSSIIISDNWAETNLTPQEALALLSGIQELRIPSHSARETTEKGSPRYTVYTPPAR